jgi:hypothetical protein
MTVYNKHTKNNCTCWNLIIVTEGIRCANCGVLVTDHTKNTKEDIKKDGTK